VTYFAMIEEEWRYS